MSARVAAGRRVHAPSDIFTSSDAGGRVRRLLVAGRVLEASGSRLRLGDAYGSINVVTRNQPQVSPGDLLVLDTRRGRELLVDARVVERHPAPESRPNGEFARLSWQGTGERLRRRARALAAIRGYFARHRFVEVDTPLRVRTPGSDFCVEAIRAQDGWLVTSPEHHMKRLLVGGMPRIFQLCHCSRADEHGGLHEPEFMMLEWYRAFCQVETVMRDTEQVVAAVARKLSGRTRLLLADGRRVDVTPPFPRLSVRDAFRRYAGVSDAIRLAARNESRFFELLVSRVEPALARRRKPVFLCDYPITQASLARPAPHDPTVAERFELYAGGVELCNGYGELTDLVEHRQRFERDLARRRRSGRPQYPLDQRLFAALEEGLPPAAGNALGVDRLLALACGAPAIADVQAFPYERR